MRPDKGVKNKKKINSPVGKQPGVNKLDFLHVNSHMVMVVSKSELPGQKKQPFYQQNFFHVSTVYLRQQCQERERERERERVSERDKERKRKKEKAGR